MLQQLWSMLKAHFLRIREREQCVLEVLEAADMEQQCRDAVERGDYVPLSQVIEKLRATVDATEHK